MKQVIIDITPDGETKIEAVGFKGKGCAEATRAIEQALGAVAKTQKKPEFDQVNQLNQGV